MKSVKSVDEYISQAPKDVQETLRELRVLIKSIAPDAKERISYGMPNYGSYKIGWVSFAAFKDHISVFITPGVLDKFSDEVKDIRTGKATLRFDLDKKIPMDLVKKLVEAAIKETKDK